jgi:hypothetical protein
MSKINNLLLSGSEKVGSGNITVTYKAHWNLDETKKLIVAFKALQREDHLKVINNTFILSAK